MKCFCNTTLLLCVCLLYGCGALSKLERKLPVNCGCLKKAKTIQLARHNNFVLTKCEPNVMGVGGIGLYRVYYTRRDDGCEMIKPCLMDKEGCMFYDNSDSTLTIRQMNDFMRRNDANLDSAMKTKIREQFNGMYMMSVNLPTYSSVYP